MQKKAAAVLAAGAATSLVLSGVAYADDISNDLDGSIDAVAEVLSLQVGGPNGTTSLYVQPTGSDGKNGCNLTGSTTLSLTVSSSDTSVATVSPSSATFTSCGDTKLLTVTAVGEGSATVSVAQASNDTGATFNLAPATFTVNVAPPEVTNTPPRVHVSGVTGGESYAKGSVPEALCEVTDAEDGDVSFPATLGAVTGEYAADGIGQQTASCSYTDRGGLSASGAVTYGIHDPTAPEIRYALSPASPDGDNGWYRGDVTLTWDVDEPDSPHSLRTAGCEDQVVSTDQDVTEYTCAATSAGGSAGPETVSLKRDASAPVVELTGALSNGSSHYFGSVPPAPTCAATDVMSGLASCVVTGGGQSVGSHTYTATATDNAGNTSTATLSYEVLAWDLRGFSQPVDMGGVFNVVKGGSTVPLKFELFAGSRELTDVAVVDPVSARKVDCSTSAAVDAIEVTATGGTSLRYDTTGGQFVYNWQTPRTAGLCYAVTVSSKDGSSRTAYVKTK